MPRRASGGVDELAGSVVLDGSSTGTIAFAGDVPTSDGPRWEWRGELGSGGMGRVALVRDHRLHRDVALKEPAGDVDLALLHREALVTAALEHPGIVPVYDVGTNEQGTPWFAMRVVRGRSLASLLGDDPSADERMALLRRVLAATEAIAFAHDRGYVHRDLKPSNVMIGTYGETQVIDWGLALAPAATARKLPEVEEASAAGTPRSMSPEQARKEQVGPASDVWSLGTILFELLAGRPVFPQTTRAEVLAAVRSGRAPSLAEVAPAVAPELVAIVQRALAPKVRDRYPHAKALADDLAAYLDGRRVSAHTYSTWDLVGRFARAWRIPLLVALAGLLLTLVVLAVSLARISDEQAGSRASLALALTAQAQRALKADSRGEAEVLAAAALDGATMPEAKAVLLALASPRPRRALVSALPCAPSDVVGARSVCHTGDHFEVFEAGVSLWRRAVSASRDALFLDRGRALAIVAGPELTVVDAASGVALGPPRPIGNDHTVELTSARKVLVQRFNRGFSVHDVERSVAVRGLCVEGEVVAAAIDANDERFAAFCRDGLVHLGTVAGGTERTLVTTLAAPLKSVLALAFVPGTGELLAGTTRGELWRFDPRAPAPERLFAADGAVRRIWVAPDGGRAAAWWDGANPLVLDLAGEGSLGRLPGQGPFAITWLSPSVVEVAGDELVRWDFDGVRARSITFDDGIAALAVSSDGQRVVAAHGASVSVIDAHSHARRTSARWQSELVKDLAYLPGGHDIVAHGFADTDVVRLAGDAVSAGVEVPAQLSLVERRRGTKRCRRVVGLADGSALCAAYGTDIYLMRTTDVHTLAAISATDLIASPDGRHVAVLSEGVVLRATDLHAGGALTACVSESGARAVAIMPDGNAVAVLLPEEVVLRCAEAADALHYRASRGADLVSVAATRGWLAAGGRAGAVWLWRIGEPEAVALFQDHAMRVDALVFDPAGRWLAAGDWGGYLAFFATPGAEPAPRAEIESAWGLTVDAALGRPMPAADETR